MNTNFRVCILMSGNVSVRRILLDGSSYCGYADFTLKFSMYKALTAFELEFNGKDSQYLNRKYMLRDYLEDSIYHSLPSDRSILECLMCE